MKSNADTADDDVVWAGPHVVCLLDLVGQQTKLAGWEDLSRSGLTSETVVALKHTVGTVLGFKDMFQNYFQVTARSYIPADWIESLPQDIRAAYTRLKDCPLNTQQFGDTFLFYSRIPNSQGDVSMGASFQLLLACCWAMIVSLASKVPFRGAISVGAGIEIAEATIYGPVLADAHHIEQHVAGQPRIVVSQKSVRFFRGNTGFSENSHVDAFMKNMAARCRSLLCHDTDGQVIVDFLGQGVLDVLNGAKPDLVSGVEKAYRFARSEAARFRQAGDDKLSARYTALVEYMKSRLPIWGLKHLAEASDVT
jgi:hypothetical protein